MPLFLLLLAGLGRVLEGGGGAGGSAGTVDAGRLFERFLPPHLTADGRDPFAAVEETLGRLTEVGRSLSLYAVPAFLWFSTRLFAGTRTALNNIYDVSVRQRRRHFALRYLLGKLRDLGMVFMTIVLFLANTAISGALALLRANPAAGGGGASGFLTSGEGRLLAQVVAFLFLVSLFFLLYRHASVRQVMWRAALVAAGFAAVAFEVAKRLFGLYLRGAADWGAAGVDATIGAGILLIIWMYYTSLVFLLGGVVVETWELRALQRAQRG